MRSTHYFRCDPCQIECRIDSEGPDSSDSTGASQIIIQHCPGSKSIVVYGKVVTFQERRGGVWVSVQPWIDAA